MNMDSQSKKLSLLRFSGAGSEMGFEKQPIFSVWIGEAHSYILNG